MNSRDESDAKSDHETNSSKASEEIEKDQDDKPSLYDSSSDAHSQNSEKLDENDIPFNTRDTVNLLESSQPETKEEIKQNNLANDIFHKNLPSYELFKNGVEEPNLFSNQNIKTNTLLNNNFSENKLTTIEKKDKISFESSKKPDQINLLDNSIEYQPPMQQNYKYKTDPRDVEMKTILNNNEKEKMKQPRKNSENGRKDSEYKYDDHKELRFSQKSQQSEFEFTPEKSVLASDEVDISIPETKAIKEGLLYTYYLYKIITKQKGKDEKEYIVYRRYSDFDWLFQNLASKYYGYIIPLPPPKNVLTTVNKEGVEFAETRKKDLAKFLRKLMRHSFLKSTPELSVFLYDDQGFLNFKKKEESINERKFDSNLIEKVMGYISTAVRGSGLPLKELDEVENQIYNYEVILLNLSKRLGLFMESMTKIIELKKNHVSHSISFIANLQELYQYNRYGEKSQLSSMILKTHLSKHEDEFIKAFSDKFDLALKEIIAYIEDASHAIARRNGLINELRLMYQAIEEKTLKFKKENTSGLELQELKKTYERLDDKLKDASQILSNELNFANSLILKNLNDLFQIYSKKHIMHYKEIHKIWNQLNE